MAASSFWMLRTAFQDSDFEDLIDGTSDRSDLRMRLLDDETLNPKILSTTPMLGVEEWHA